MIILKRIENKEPVSFLIFSNENGNEVSIPVVKRVANLIVHHLKAISKDNLVSERLNVEDSD